MASSSTDRSFDMLSPIFVWRGLIHQTTDDAEPARLAERAAAARSMPASIRRPTACTSAILMPLMILRRFQRAGHRPIALVGGATGMIGDPSGKSEERNLLSVDVLRANVAGDRSADAALPRFRRGSNAAAAGQQLRLDEPLQLSRISCATSASTFPST